MDNVWYPWSRDIKESNLSLCGILQVGRGMLWFYHDVWLNCCVRVQDFDQK